MPTPNAKPATPTVPAAAQPSWLGAVTITKPDTRKVYDRADSNGKVTGRQVLVCNAKVAIIGTPLTLVAKVYQNLELATGETGFSISFPGTGIRGASSSVLADGDDKQAFRDHVDAAVSEWPAADAEIKATEAMLLGQTAPKPTEPNKPTSRLVGRKVEVKTADPAKA